MSNNLNSHAYIRQNRQEYLSTMDRIGLLWLSVFDTTPEDKTFWDTAYWDLFTKLWRANAEVKKTDAINYIVGKTTPTAAKYLNIAIEKGLISERDNPNHSRSKLVGLSESMRQRLDKYFDSAFLEIENFVESARERAEV